MGFFHHSKIVSIPTLLNLIFSSFKYVLAKKIVKRYAKKFGFSEGWTKVTETIVAVNRDGMITNLVAG